MENQRNVSEFIFVELSSDQNMQMFCFVFFLFCYVVLLVGNLLILVSIRCSVLFHQPMYYCLSHLSFMDICYTSCVISDLLLGRKTISYGNCILQVFTMQFLASSRSLSLQSWPLTTAFLSASFSTTWLSWTGQGAISSSWQLELVGLSMPFLSSLW